MHDNNVSLYGSGPLTLVLAHGYGCDQDMWRFVIPTLSASYRVVTFDQAGCGRRGVVPYDPQRHNSLLGYAHDVVTLLRRLALGPVVFVGHSVSAMIGVLAAKQAPELFRALVMIGPSPCYLNDGIYQGGFSASDLAGLLDALDANHRSWAASLAPVIMANLNQPHLSSELEESFCRMDPIAARGFARATFLSDNRADLASVCQPTLILQCDQDAIANNSVGRYVHDHINHSILMQLTATGHCPHLSAPNEVIQKMMPWFKNLHD